MVDELEPITSEDNTNDEVESVEEEQTPSGDEEIIEETSKGLSPEDKIKKRLGRQAKKYQREMRALQEEVAYLRSNMQSPMENSMSDGAMNSPATPNDEIYQAVVQAFKQKEREQEHAKNAQQVAHVQRQLEHFTNKLDNASDKYEDFDDVVRNSDAPFTPAMRDAAAHLLPFDNADEVLYKLGKDRSKLEKISGLHPVDQARELIKLSAALGGVKTGEEQSGPAKTFTEVKSGLGPRTAMSSKASVGEIRQRMKEGKWK